MAECGQSQQRWCAAACWLIVLAPGLLMAQFERPTPPFAPAAGQPGSTAVAHNDARIVGWATGYRDYVPGSNVSIEWQVPSRALGPVSTDFFDVVVLGDAGHITMTFDPPIRNGSGFDFAVFENAFSNTFLELAFVEVSSDGQNFARFPSYSLTPGPVPGFGHVDPTLVYGLAGKYRVGFGTPFDLQELADAYALAMTRENWRGPDAPEFSQAYRDALVAAFPHVDLENIRYVRILDIVGDGSALDSEGFAIFDPHPTMVSAGFDLSGVAVLNAAQQPELPVPALVLVPAGTAYQVELHIPLETLQPGGYSLQLSLDMSTWSTITPPAISPGVYDVTAIAEQHDNWFIRLIRPH